MTETQSAEKFSAFFPQFEEDLADELRLVHSGTALGQFPYGFGYLRGRGGESKRRQGFDHPPMASGGLFLGLSAWGRLLAVGHIRRAVGADPSPYDSEALLDQSGVENGTVIEWRSQSCGEDSVFLQGIEAILREPYQFAEFRDGDVAVLARFAHGFGLASGGKVDWRVPGERLFQGYRRSGASPERRIKFIDDAKARRVLSACPDDGWRLIFALARYGGLRVPSELVSLKWEDIDWQAGRFTVTCIKTKHHEGRELRLVPIFPELRPYLENWRDQAPEDSKWVIGRSRSGKANLRTQMLRILKRARIAHWPKLFQNLRSSRETELMAVYPAHVVCA